MHAAHPLRRVILFGSHARGEARPDSDVDLCLVADGAEKQYDTATTWLRSVWDFRPKPSFTLVPITPARLGEKQVIGDYFFQTVLREGVLLAGEDRQQQPVRPTPHRRVQLGIAVAFVIALILKTPFAARGEERNNFAEQIAAPLLHWIYFSELPPGAGNHSRREGPWSAALKDVLTKSSVQTAWVRVIVGGATNTFTFDIKQRKLTPVDIPEKEFLRVNAIGDGTAGLQQFLVVRVQAAFEPKGFAVQFDTGSSCHGRFGNASYDRTGQVITLTSIGHITSKCCF